MKALAAVTLALSGAVIAVAAPIDGLPLAALGQESMVTLPMQQRGTVQYFNGGAGLDEMAYLKSRSREFPLQVLFSGRGGEYVIADSVRILEGSREIVTINDAGPLLMLQVPPGHYTVEANFGGFSERRTVNLGTGVSKLNWNAPKASDR